MFTGEITIDYMDIIKSLSQPQSFVLICYYVLIVHKMAFSLAPKVTQMTSDANITLYV